MTLALVALAGLCVCASIAWVRRPIATGHDSGSAAAEATIRAALAATEEPSLLLVPARLAA